MNQFKKTFNIKHRNCSLVFKKPSFIKYVTKFFLHIKFCFRIQNGERLNTPPKFDTVPPISQQQNRPINIHILMIEQVTKKITHFLKKKI